VTEAERLRWTQLAAFAAIYLIWGSTYLAIRIAIETLPGLLMAGARFMLGGLVLYGLARLRGAARPRPEHWRTAAVIGLFLFLGGNGGVVFAEHWVPSGLTALFVGVEPLWVVVALALWPRGAERPTPHTVVSLLVGFVGVALLALSGQSIDAGAIPVLPLIVVVLAPLSWAVGSVYSRGAATPDDPFLAAGMQMLSGGLALGAAGFATGEAAAFDPAAVTTRSLVAFAYLVVLGSIVAFTAYGYLVRTTKPTLVATYAYVNPIVAVFLGWLVADERVGATTLVASALIIGAVALIGLEARRLRRRVLVDGVVAGPPADCALSGGGAADEGHGVAAAGPSRAAELGAAAANGRLEA
jgi:drug/metabolite transporter (DMT)-like permease